MTSIKLWSYAYGQYEIKVDLKEPLRINQVKF